MTTTQHAAAHAVADRLHGRPAVRSFLEGPELTAACLSMVLLVREDGEDADRPMPTVTVAEIPQTVRESSSVEEDLEPLGGVLCGACSALVYLEPSSPGERAGLFGIEGRWRAGAAGVGGGPQMAVEEEGLGAWGGAQEERDPRSLKTAQPSPSTVPRRRESAPGH
ncbi:hypothetical protein ACFVSN_39850 [Kitasatospora sp. NPDC057904]|uniref:hypothetical protein n=1 Tax=Kitasatospora sp. NPDC057904 TaxID=3346275 RepID=UPI0036DBF2AA